nr:unnamed protein product [Digitaria exilis]
MAAALGGLVVLLALLAAAEADTDAGDVTALGNLYSSWNSPAQLVGWSAGGGDPCGAAWTGITCSGTAVTSIKLSGMELNGTLGYELSGLQALKTMDLSNNFLHDAIPYQLPPNLTYLDISFNDLTGNLPVSMASLSKVSSLFMQNNQLSGPVDVLSNLSLATLNIANNNFSGMIPQEFSSIPNLIVEGNSFANMPASPPPTLTPPPKNTRDQPNHPDEPISAPNITGTPIDQDDKKMQTGPLVGIAVGSIAIASCVLFTLIFCLHKTRKRNDYGSSEPKDIVGALAVNIERASNREIPTPSNSNENAVVATSDLHSNGKMTPERVYGTNGSTVKKAKVLAVKKIDSASLSLYEEENFLEVISNISRLKHPNIVSLTGYCVEHGQRLLVYEYIGNGTLHDILHFSDGMGKKLTWNTRVRIALGAARALEYLHEVCLPPIVHRSFKSSNILLDEEYSPHLSDCGLAALSPNPEREVSAEVVGSFGYSAPEFAMSGAYTTKSDVYSFGVVMLELLTGRKPLDRSRERSEQSLVRWATPQLHDIDLLAKMVDPAMDGLYPAKSLSRFADIIAICVQSEPEFRPPMSEVVQQLVRLMQRASIIRRQSDDIGYSYRVPESGTGDVF